MMPIDRGLRRQDWASFQQEREALHGLDEAAVVALIVENTLDGGAK
jgi:hypothetical protein